MVHGLIVAVTSLVGRRLLGCVDFSSCGLRAVEWAWGWRKKGWIKSDKKPALNPDLWEVLLNLTMTHQLHYHWVKGHADNPKNNRCDQLAVTESKKFM